MSSKNIYSRKYFFPITADQECFKNKYKNVDLKNARELASKILVIPLYEDLEIKKIEDITNIIKYKGEVEIYENKIY